MLPRLLLGAALGRRLRWAFRSADGALALGRERVAVLPLGAEFQAAALGRTAGRRLGLVFGGGCAAAGQVAALCCGFPRALFRSHGALALLHQGPARVALLSGSKGYGTEGDGGGGRHGKAKFRDFHEHPPEAWWLAIFLVAMDHSIDIDLQQSGDRFITNGRMPLPAGC